MCVDGYDFMGEKGEIGKERWGEDGERDSEVGEQSKYSIIEIAR